MSLHSLDDIPLLMDVFSVAAVLDVSPGTVYGLIRSKQLAAIRIGKKFRITRTALLEYLGM